MTLADLLQEARSELDMIESAPSTFGTAARFKARERVRLLDKAVRVEAAAEALSESRMDGVQDGCSCPECGIVRALRGLT